MPALSVWKSIYKYPLRNIIYVLLLCTAFTTISLLLYVPYTNLNIQSYLSELLETGVINEVIHSNLIGTLAVTVASLLPMYNLILLFCVITLPFVNYIFCIGRGYEIGVLRALGLSKTGAWKRLITENIILVCVSLVITQCITIVLYKKFTRSLLAIDYIEESVFSITGDISGLNQNLGVDLRALIYLSVVAFVITVISTGLQGIIIAKNEPMKLIRNYK